ncbi:alcohol dehydrogenase GroES-like domain-containing protein [Stachybotrys elegans]|uniref:Alcohol dehydrogenase GroES-like domain-containing protein n=1 Tax=Stachybotrys elegans TaxID=80388 RepID=A0A8K0SCZ6_9HYPO|nr:alcohol dehydrogenase GroES-like domain-containing protein [Stachybotrys elegans]
MELPKSYKQAAFKGLGEPLSIEEVELKLPGVGEVLVKVEACGVCHSEVFSQYNVFGGGFPRVPGHELIGRVVAIGSDVAGWKVGDRIGGGYHGGHDGVCNACIMGLPQMCEPYIVNGVTRDGGYAEYCILLAKAGVRIPDEVDAAMYAPMLCAGVTVFNAIRSASLQPGDTVAVQGLGGLGHLAVQIAKKMGYRVVAISRGPEKEKAAEELGANEYIDSSAGDAGAALRDLGYAKLVVTTAMATDAIAPLIKGVGIFGKLAILSVPENGEITVNSNEMMMRGISVQSWPVGNCYDSEKVINFALLQGVECAIETFPLERAQEAFEKMLSGKVRFRAVLTMG